MSYETKSIHIDKYITAAQPAEWNYTTYYDMPEGRVPNVEKLRDALIMLIEAGVPADAQINLQGTRLYAHWKRDPAEMNEFGEHR